MDTSSRIFKNEGDSWSGVQSKAYKTDEQSSFCGVKRHVLLGKEYEALNFHTRYFELDPDGYSSLEYHVHPHTVIVLQGKGRVILEDSINDIHPHDVVYIAPHAIHQFIADAQEGLGFLCIVDRYRDRPVQPSRAELNNRISDQKVLSAIRL